MCDVVRRTEGGGEREKDEIVSRKCLQGDAREEGFVKESERKRKLDTAIHRSRV